MLGFFTASLPSPAPRMAPPIEAVVREQADFVYRSLRHLGVHDNDLPDQCQEVFLVVSRRLDEWQGRSSLRTWVYGICRGTVLNYRRTRRRRPETLVAELPEAPAVGSPHDALEQKRQQHALHEALESLSLEQREVFVLYEIEHLPVATIAQMVEAPVKTVYSRLSAARAAVLRRFPSEGSS